MTGKRPPSLTPAERARRAGPHPDELLGDTDPPAAARLNICDEIVLLRAQVAGVRAICAIHGISHAAAILIYLDRDQP